ncbi:RND family efflux transporter, MFP subunit [Tissierella praeacuta DSM 18095]|uniref:RND family efflux transporter, MFP subunit n=1 Tax=Tissierella praeacuta DSM 18095 TaxID=1123404 RepID=A0A1M4XUQ0_9FIRM|nr:efflux RND transporter periplasmic adaptor subunit [Tissierella praeacuta]SHE97307.1 RND family efflux transporter, MFP subunit [Tissierella praeacuta DSM 18095]SUO99215.1 Cation efflux system protein CzcB [Tissierella praeacuta]
MKSRKTKLLILLVILTTMLYGCKNKDVEVMAEPLKPVKIMEVKTQDYSDDIEISGNVKPAQLVKQGFKVAGVVGNIYVKEGDRISEGQTLMSLNPHDYELGVIAAQAQYDSLNMQLSSKIDSSINQAKANLDFIKTQLDRVRRLHEKGAVATKTVEELEVSLIVAENKYKEALDAKETAEAQLRQAGAALELAQSQLNDTVLHSPIDGTVVKQIFEVGETIAPGYPAFVLGRLDTLEVEVGVPDNLIDNIKVGEKVKLFIYGIDKELEGVISNIDATADLETRTFGVKIDIDNKDGDIKPGMIANVVINMDKVTTIIVPIDSVVDDANKSTIFVYDENTKTVSKREVKVGTVFGDHIQIVEGLKDGELVVVHGQFGLLEGEEVNARRVEKND